MIHVLPVEGDVAFTLNPIIVKELRARMRGSRTFAILSLCLIGLAGLCYAIIQVYAAQARAGSFVISAHVGRGLFAALALAETLLITFLAPAVTAGAISGEREQLTYDLLVATPLRPGRILSGKLVAALSYLLLLIFAAVPFGSLVLIFGGVAPGDLFQALALLLLTVLTFGMIGLLCSALARRTLTATILAYTIVLFLVAGSYFAVMLRMAARPDQPAGSSRIVALNPFSAMASIVARGGQTPIAKGAVFMDAPIGKLGASLSVDPAAPMMNIPGFNALTVGLLENDPTGPSLAPMYRWTIVLYPLLGLSCYWLAAHLVRPRRRWRLDLHDLAMFATLATVAGLGTWWLGLWPGIVHRLGL